MNKRKYYKGQLKYLKCEYPDLPETPSMFWEDTGSLFIAGTASVIGAAFILDNIVKKEKIIAQPLYAHIIKSTLNCCVVTLKSIS